MRKMIVLLLAAGFAANMSSCYTGRPIARKAPDNNATYRVDYLFEHEGCKVYRFQDMGEYIYFTNCSGSLTTITNDSTRYRIQTIVKNDPSE